VTEFDTSFNDAISPALHLLCVYAC